MQVLLLLHVIVGGVVCCTVRARSLRPGVAPRPINGLASDSWHSTVCTSTVRAPGGVVSNVFGG
jgi:hypothetical protein